MRAVFVAALYVGLIAAPAAAQQVNVGPGGGLTVTSDDGRFSVKLGGRIQALYQHDARDAASSRVLLGDAGTRPVLGDRSGFRVRRGRLALSGHVFDPAWQYKIQFELSGSAMTLKDAYANWRGLGPAVQVRVGQFKVPFGRQELTSAFKQQLVDRSVASGAFADGWDQGVMVWGKPLAGQVEYYAGVFNGEGINRKGQGDAVHEWAGRLVWTPVGSVGYDATAWGSSGPALALGVNGRWNGGWLYDVDGVPGLSGPVETCTLNGCVVDEGDDARIATLGTDLAARWGRVAVNAEAFRRRIDPRREGAPVRESRGWYAEGGVLVGERVETGLRYAALDPDTDGANDEVTEVAPFAAVYLVGHDLKLQADYAWLRHEHGSDAGSTLTDRRLRAQLILSF